ncbi:MAG: 2-dehydropantoate 2-reductase [Puniceicoccaceae bacterium]|nr:MAG: 2-dehydropantoate 2-reductase [Puniceicoccaceae bacterium]
MKIGVIGSGAVGLWYGGLLARAGHEVHFLLRSDLEAVRRDGVVLKSADGEDRLRGVGAHASTSEIGPCDLVLIALKATSNAVLPELLPPLLVKATVVLTLQNGLGNEEVLAGLTGEDRILGGLCFVCLNRVAPGVVENYLPGLVSLGAHTETGKPQRDRVAEVFRQAGITVRVAESLAEARWRKLVWNVPFNGLAIAAGGITTDRIVGDEGLLAVTRELMAEVCAAAAGEGFSIPERFIEQQIEVTRGMGAYRPSSLVDWEAGRVVEVEAIWGLPWRRARAAGVETPRLGMLYRLLAVLGGRGSAGGRARRSDE